MSNLATVAQASNVRVTPSIPDFLAPYFSERAWEITFGAVQGFVILVSVVILAALLVMAERRLLAWWQDRYGPNRVGPFGLLQIVADMLKMMFKEDWTPEFADKFIFRLAPAIAIGTAMISFAIIPITPSLGASDMSVGLLFFFGMAGIAVYAVMFGAWASNNKYSLLGGMRSAAQTISYEVFMGLSLMGVVAIAGSFNMRDIVMSQQHMWNVIPQFFGFIVFCIAGVAVTHRFPFDQPEAEQEIADGYHIEYSGLKFGMFFVGEYVSIVLISALMTTLFFGGWLAPFNLEISWLPPFFWFMAKTSFFIMMFILIRGSLMRPRYDQVMNFGWKVCLPIALINLLVTGAVILYRMPA